VGPEPSRAEPAAAAASSAAERESEAIWRAVARHAPDGMLLTAPDGRILAANPAACALLGRTEEETCGAGRAGILVVDEAAKRLIEERRRTGRARGVVTLRRKDGSTFLADVASIVFTNGTAQTWTSLTLRDVTEQERARQALEILADAGRVLASSLDLRTTLKHLTDLVVPKLADVCTVDLVEPDGVNRVAIAHRDPACVAAFEQVRRHGVREDASGGVDYVLRTGEPSCIFELTDDWLRTAAHDWRHFEMARALGVRSFLSVPLRARSLTIGALTLMSTGGVPSFGESDLHLVQALGERAANAIDNARLHHQAQRATQAREETITAVSHDLGSPLGAIIGTADLLSRSGITDEERRSLIAGLRRSALWMKRITEDLVDANRIDAGHFTVEKKSCAIRQLLTEMLELMRPLTDQQNLALLVRFPDQELDLPCERERILRVFSNLVGNAIKFSPEGASITVTASLDGSEVRFAVIDSGRGISAEELPHVFDRFWQASRPSRAGSGLGLAIAQGIVKAHGGRIWAESEPGTGSTFFFTLPVGEGERGEAAVASPPA